MEEERSLDERIQGLLAVDLYENYSSLYEAYEHLLFQYAKFFLRDSGWAEDAVQEAFLRAYQALRHRSEQEIGTMSLKPWLVMIVRNACFNKLSREKRRRQYMCEEESHMEDVPDKGEYASPEYLVIESERKAKVFEFVNEHMTKRYRDCVRLSLEGWSAQEIAEKLYMSLSSVRTYISKGLRELREHTDDNGEIV